jgi:hypothetical protein
MFQYHPSFLVYIKEYIGLTLNPSPKERDFSTGKRGGEYALSSGLPSPSERGGGEALLRMKQRNPKLSMP